MSNLAESINKLIMQAKLDSLPTKDLVAELDRLFKTGDQLERDLRVERERVEGLNKELKVARDELAAHRTAYVIPAQKLREAEATLERDRFKFDVEKAYLSREVQIYSQIVAQLTGRARTDESYYGGNSGASHTLSQHFVTPNLPASEGVKK